MMSKTAAPKYDLLARLMHWLIVVLLIAQYAIAWTMPDIHRGTQPVGLIQWHLQFGTAIIAVMIVRLVWRLLRREPDVVDGTAFTRQAARFTHGILYLLLIVQPLMGWANASSRDWTVTLFGVIPLPPLSAAGSRLGHAMGDIHQIFAWGMLGLVGVHVAAALYHHFMLRDGVLRRMA
jgi:cytochrome b561